MSTRNEPHRFDFEIGYLIKSPCGRCEHYIRFPVCAKTCDIIEQIQARLAASVPCTRREAF